VPHVIPSGADAPGITFTAFTVIDAGSLEQGVLVGATEYCFKKPQSGFTCDYHSREPFVWKQASGMAALDRLNAGGLEFFSSFVSDDGDTVVGAYNTADGFGGFFRWTKADGATTLGEPAGTNSGSPYAMSSDGRTVVGMAKVADKAKADIGHAHFLWTEQAGYQALADDVTWPASGEVVGLSSDGLTLFGQTTAASDTHMAFRWTKAGGAQPLGNLAGRTHCRIDRATADASAIFGVCEDDQQVGRAFRWTEALGMQELGNAGDSCVMRSVFSISADGSVAFGSVECGDNVYAPGRWAMGAGVAKLPPAPSNFHTDLPITSSADGKLAFGLLLPGSGEGFPGQPGTAGTEAYRYVAGGSVEPLPPPTGQDFTAASAVDALGRVVVGRSGSQGAGSRAVLWDASGLVDIASYLTTHGVSLDGLDLSEAERVAVSGDTIVVQGYANAQNRGGVWFARILLSR
jgi:uncharacterized membrane protein